MAVETTNKKPRSAAQIAHAQRLAQLNKDRAAMPPPPPAEGAVLDSQEDVLKQLAEFAGLMGDAVKKKTDTKKVLDQVADLLNTLDPAVYGEVLSHPVVEKLTGAVMEVKQQDQSMAAGSSLGQAIGKKPYTWRDVMPDRMDWVEYTPRRTIPVCWNGVDYYFQEDKTVYCPKCFVDIEEESRRNQRLAKEHIEWWARKRDSVSDPSLLADGSGRVRGMFTGGLTGGTGLDIAVPDADRPGLESAGEGEEGEPAA